MKKILLATLASLLTLGSFAQHTLSSDDMADFSAVHVQGKIVMTIVAAEQAVLSAEVTNAEDANRFSWYVKDNCLYIKLSRGLKDVPNASVRLAVPSLETLTVVDANVTIEPFEAPLFELDASAGADVVMNLTCSDIAVKAVGNSTVKINGSSKYAEFTSQSSSMINATNFETRSTQVNTSVMGEAIVNASERLVAQAVTNSTIRYLGDPSIARLKTSTKGEIFKVD